MILAGTGHRLDKLGGYDDARAFQNTLWLARRCIEELEPKRVISGMAIGWDQALALAAVQLGVPFVAAIPFTGQERRWPAEAQGLYRILLDKADDAVVLSEKHSLDAFQLRNEWMVDRATDVLALFNGSRGGTRNCVLYAQAVGKPVLNVWDRWRDLDQLV